MGNSYTDLFLSSLMALISIFLLPMPATVTSVWTRRVLDGDVLVARLESSSERGFLSIKELQVETKQIKKKDVLHETTMEIAA